MEEPTCSINMDTVNVFDIIPISAALPSSYTSLPSCSNFQLVSSVVGPSIKKKRAAPWTSVEESVLLEEVQKRETALFGKFKGPGKGKSLREAAWSDVASAINCINTETVRSAEEAKKKYDNIKQRAKEKLTNMKRPKTGGGPKPPSPSPVEQQLLDSLEGRPSLEGIENGMDSGDLQYVNEPSPVPAKVCKTLVKSKPAESSSKKPSSILSLEREVLAMEKSKLEIEIDVLELKKEKLKEEIELIQLKKQEMKIKLNEI